MSTTATKNIGVFTNPAHELYVGQCEPAVNALNPGPDEVVVHVRSSGICGSDIHFQKEGNIGPTMVVRDEHILGHESAGEVISVGSDVADLKVGDRVALEGSIPCQNCEFCMSGKYNACDHMKFRSTPPIPGFLARYVIHPARWCHKIGQMSFEYGALLEPLCVALMGLDRAGIRLGDPVLICGAGPIGLMSALCARAAGASPLVITDLDAGRLQFAKNKVPGLRTVQISRGESPEDVSKKVIAAAGGKKLRVTVECTGVESSIAAGMYSLTFGGTIFIIGVGKPVQSYQFMHCSTNEINIKFQYRYANIWPRAIQLINDNVIDISGIVSHRFKLEEAAKAFETAADPSTGAVKVMIEDGL